MRNGLTISATALLTLTAPAVQGQAAPASDSAPRGIPSSGTIRPSAELAGAELAGEVLREIDDPRNGDRWLLIEDARHPGGPGVLVLAHHDSARQAQSRNVSMTEAAVPVIHAGDRVVVEEHTAVVEARLEAVAMGPAIAGSAFHARLSVGGMMVRVVALAPGRAALQEETRR